METVLDSQLANALLSLNIQQKKAVLNIVNAFKQESENDQIGRDQWNDVDFVAEMDARYEYYKSGGKMVTIDDMAQLTKKLLQDK